MDAIFEAIDALLLKKPRALVAIDGQSASGKTTLAEEIRGHFGGNTYHMDDFFLPPEKRRAVRLSQPGGNVDYERFAEAALAPILAGVPFSYRPFSCKTGALSSPVSVRPAKLEVIEGAYSQHPYFCDPYDLKIFLGIDEEIQRARILKRNGERAEMFFSKWIPMENRYLAFFSIAAHAQIARVVKA